MIVYRFFYPQFYEALIIYDKEHASDGRKGQGFAKAPTTRPEIFCSLHRGIKDENHIF